MAEQSESVTRPTTRTVNLWTDAQRALLFIRAAEKALVDTCVPEDSRAAVIASALSHAREALGSLALGLSEGGAE